MLVCQHAGVHQALVPWRLTLASPWQGRYRHDPPSDPALAQAWERFEDLLGRRLPAANRLLAPDHAPDYDRTAWQIFLRTRGYQPTPAHDHDPLAPIAWQKPLR